MNPLTWIILGVIITIFSLTFFIAGGFAGAPGQPSPSLSPTEVQTNEVSPIETPTPSPTLTTTPPLAP